MECKEAEKAMDAFEADQLEYKDLEAFLEHIEVCENCREELAIRMLVNEGVSRLENGGDFDLKKEIDDHMERAWKKVRLHRRMRYASFGFELLGIIVIVALVIWVFVK